jgi:hypothetical protein
MTHMGRRGHSRESGIPLRAPSDVPEPVHREVPVPLDAEEIPPIVERFAAAARRLEACGWDGCEVTSLGGHLIEQFFDPRSTPAPIATAAASRTARGPPARCSRRSGRRCRTGSSSASG